MLLHMTTMTATTGATGWMARNGSASWTSQAKRMRLVVDTAPDSLDDVDGGPVTDTAERRRGLRVRQCRPVRLLDMGRGRTVLGQTLDVSVTGLRVELPATAGLRVGDVLGVHVGPAQFGGRPLANRKQLVPVRIVWVDADGGRDGHLLAGVEFSAATTTGAQRDAA